MVRAHSIGHNLEDVKIEFKKDLKLDVANITIDGKNGEILNVPRWIANVLESEKNVEINDVDMITELKQAATKEVVQGDFDLSTLAVSYTHLTLPTKA